MTVREREHRLIECTTSICPQCMERVDAKIIARDGSIYVLKYCEKHGEQLALLERDADYYLARQAFDKPGTESTTQTEVRQGCPFDCGLCPQHDQHTCIAIIDITGQCNLNCPDCYARSASAPQLDLEQVSRMMDFYREAEFGEPEVVQISGGEPTTHPDILDILQMGRDKGIKCVMLNTNGIRIAEDEAFARRLGEMKGGFEVYLQFDGFDGVASGKLRNRDLVAVKKRAIENLVRHEIPVTLVATIEQGVNDHEIGNIIMFGLDTPCVRGANFQPIAFFRGSDRCDPADRTTLTDILRKAEEQTEGTVKQSDFIPLPCNVERVAITYLYRANDTFMPITRTVNLRDYLPLIRNTFAFDADEILEMPRHLASCPMPGVCDCVKKFCADLRPLITETYEKGSLAEKIDYLNRNVFRISVSSFVDVYNFDMRSMKKECVHFITPDLRRIPFSSHNMFHRTP